MEARGCNRWQSVANAGRPRMAENKRKPLPSVATGCRGDGKEGVDGSSPSEGSQIPAKRAFRTGPSTELTKSYY